LWLNRNGPVATMAETCCHGMTVVFARVNVTNDQSIRKMPLAVSASPATFVAAPPGIVHGRHCCSAHMSANGVR